MQYAILVFLYFQYGFVNHALEMMMMSKFGEDTWEEIRYKFDTIRLESQ